MHILPIVLFVSLLPAQQSEPAAITSATRAPLVDSPALQAARQLQRGFADVAEHVWPSVVTVRAYERVATRNRESAKASAKKPGWVAPSSSTYEGFREYSSLTGWVVHQDGEILTCNHGLLKPDGSRPDLIDIETNDFQRILCERVGIEPTVNLAILQAVVWPNSHPKKLAALEWADSDAVRSGNLLLCFGDPSGPGRFLQTGTFIAHPQRDCYQDLLGSFYIQVGLVAHPQAYGGPMVDLEGRVVAMLAPNQTAPGTWQASQRLGVEFGLPSKIVSGLHAAIREVRSFESPWLGFAVMSRPELAKERGLDAYHAIDKPKNGILIENVFEPGPAAAAGIQPGDWLVTFGRTRIFTPVDFQKQLYLAGVGGEVRVEVYRSGAMASYELVIEKRPDAAKPR